MGIIRNIAIKTAIKKVLLDLPASLENFSNLGLSYAPAPPETRLVLIKTHHEVCSPGIQHRVEVLY
jgi:hypothetical protein